MFLLQDNRFIRDVINAVQSPHLHLSCLVNVRWDLFGGEALDGTDDFLSDLAAFEAFCGRGRSKTQHSVVTAASSR